MQVSFIFVCNMTLCYVLVTDKNVNEIQLVARGYIYGFPITIPLNNTNACIESGLSCPLEAGNNYNYSSTLKVYEQCPRVIYTIF